MNRNQIRKLIADALIYHSMYLSFLNRGLSLHHQLRYGSSEDATVHVLQNIGTENYDLHIYHKRPLCICKYLQLSQKQ